MPVATDVTPRLRQVTMRLSRLLRQHSDASLSQSLSSALATVARSGPLTVGRLASLERVQPPSMTRIVSALEEQGLVSRVVDPSDRRASLLSVTAAGTSRLGELRSQRDSFLAARIESLSATDRRALEAALPALERLAGLST